MAEIPKFSELMESSRGQPSAAYRALERASLALQMNRPAEAERIATDILKANRTHLDALQILARALLQQGRAEDAIRPLEKALRRSNDPAVETWLAIALRTAGRDDDALARLRQAIARKPPYAPAFHEIGQLLANLHRVDEAIAALRQGEALMPEVADLSVQIGYLYAGQNDRANARAAFLRALGKDADSIQAVRGLAYALQLDGEYAQAAEMFRRLLRAGPNDVEARIALGLCLLELSQPEAGVQNLRSAMRINQKAFGQGLAALAASARGRFWLRRSDAVRFVRGEGS
jgi:tetratricopeptide (TPR) repeat protein